MPFVALGRLWQVILALDRCEQPHLRWHSLKMLMCHTCPNVSSSPRLARLERLGTASGKGSLSYAREAYGVKNKMTRSVWKRWMYNGSSAVCSSSTSATHAVPSHSRPAER